MALPVTASFRYGLTIAGAVLLVTGTLCFAWWSDGEVGSAGGARLPPPRDAEAVPSSSSSSSALLRSVSFFCCGIGGILLIFGLLWSVKANARVVSRRYQYHFPRDLQYFTAEPAEKWNCRWELVPPMAFPLGQLCPPLPAAPQHAGLAPTCRDVLLSQHAQQAGPGAGQRFSEVFPSCVCSGKLCWKWLQAWPGQGGLWLPWEQRVTAGTWGPSACPGPCAKFPPQLSAALFFGGELRAEHSEDAPLPMGPS
uniref:Transmembrane protein 61 n=1 Tax=Zonotrichia albicollis TaxID=44394 RepID=A0A8D2QB19_ZONAL